MGVPAILVPRPLATVDGEVLLPRIDVEDDPVPESKAEAVGEDVVLESLAEAVDWRCR